MMSDRRYRTSLYLSRNDVVHAKARGLNLSAYTRAALRSFNGEIAPSLRRAVQMEQVLQAELETLQGADLKDEAEEFRAFIARVLPPRDHIWSFPEYEGLLAAMAAHLQERFNRRRDRGTYPTPQAFGAAIIEATMRGGYPLASFFSSDIQRAWLEMCDKGKAETQKVEEQLAEVRKERDLLVERFRQDTTQFFQSLVDRFLGYEKRLGRPPGEDESIVWISSFVDMARILLMVDDLNSLELLRLLNVAMASGPPEAADQVLEGLGLR